MKKLIAFTVAMLALAGSAAHADVCVDQIVDYVETRLETNAVSIYLEGGHGNTAMDRIRAWTKVESCSGYYVFDLWASELDCNSAHYGTIPNYIRRVWTTGDCR